MPPSALLARSVTAVVIVAVYVAAVVSGAEGVNTAVRLLVTYVTAPVGFTQGAAQVTVKLEPVSVAGDTSSLKIALTVELFGTPVVGPGAVVTGEVEVTVGLVVSSVAPVVNVHT